jgi:hypothetical protein
LDRSCFGRCSGSGSVALRAASGSGTPRIRNAISAKLIDAFLIDTSRVRHAQSQEFQPNRGIENVQPSANKKAGELRLSPAQATGDTN